MRDPDTLRLPLAIAALYTLAIGVVQLFPSLAEVVFDRPVIDAAVESLYGSVLLALGGITAVLAADRRRSRTLVWVVIGGVLLSTIDVAVYWRLGEIDARAALVPIVLNLALAGWLVVGIARETSGLGERAGGQAG